MPSLPEPRGLVAVAAIAVSGFALVAAALWYFLLRDDELFRYVIGYEPPPAVSLVSAIESISAAAVSGPASVQGNAATPRDAGTTPDDLTGTWTVVPGDFSFAGYRVVETLASFGTNTAVGRTTAVDGTLDFDGEAISSVEISADLEALVSDQSERDEQLRYQAIETDTYPEARFVLATPIPIDEVQREGERVSHTVRGELTLHGVTRPIELQAEGVLRDGLLIVVASTEVRFENYAIEQPRSFSVLSTEDHGTLEIQLVFGKASSP